MGLFSDFRALVWIKKMALAQERQARALEELLRVTVGERGFRTYYTEKNPKMMRPEEQIFSTSDSELARMEREEEERRLGVRFPEEEA